MASETFATDEERATAVLWKALECTAGAFVPLEVIMLVMLLEERLDPKDAIVTAYLLGRCNGDPDALDDLHGRGEDSQRPATL